MKFIYTLFAGLLLCMQAYATPITVGSSLPSLNISDKGELDGKGGFTPWSSSTLNGQKQLVIYMAGRWSTKKMIDPLTARLEQIKTPGFKSTTILNGDDVTFGASSVALKEMRTNKQRFPEASLVFDANGKGLNTWSLLQASATVLVLDNKGRVELIKQGELNSQDVKVILNALGVSS